MRSVLAYTAGRILLFAVAFGVVYLLGARGLLAALIALVISALVSYVLLQEQRDALARQVATWVEGVRGVSRRLDEGAAAEDPDGNGDSDTGTVAERPENSHEERRPR